tara:strand:+ start:152 stop:478 length:327 start_codon:yes stop_codon:yes gene_type:complete
MMMILRKNLFILIFFVFNCFVPIVLSEPSYNALFLGELKKCFDAKINNKCKEMIFLTERMQLREYQKGNLKCQTSILGFQTELINNIYFDRDKNNVAWKTIPSLIKNC